MSDVFTKTKRSAVMSRIRSKGNKDTELRLIAVFRANGITGWRRSVTIRVQRSDVSGQKPSDKRQELEGGGQTLASNRAKPTGKSIGVAALRPCVSARNIRKHRPFSVKPDFVFPKLRLAVFVDGCFWHGCPIHATWPKQNGVFWRTKILGNKARDRRVDRTLRKTGWRVLRIWEHELARRNEARLLRRLTGCSVELE